MHTHVFEILITLTYIAISEQVSQNNEIRFFLKTNIPKLENNYHYEP